MDHQINPPPSWPSVYDDISNINIPLNSENSPLNPSNSSIHNTPIIPDLNPVDSSAAISNDLVDSKSVQNQLQAMAHQHMAQPVPSTGPSNTNSPQEYQPYFDFSNMNLDPSQPFPSSDQNSPMFLQDSQLASQQHHASTMSPKSQLESISNQLQQLHQMQQFQQFQNLQNQIQQLQNFHQQAQMSPNHAASSPLQQSHHNSPRSAAPSPNSNSSVAVANNMSNNNLNSNINNKIAAINNNLRLQAAQNNQNINALQSNGNLDTILHDLFHDYNETNNLDSLIIDSTSNNSLIVGHSVPPLTPTNLEPQNTVMTNDIFNSPMSGPVDKSSLVPSSAVAEQFTPLMSPTVTPFDSISTAIASSNSEFTMPAPYYTGSSASASVFDDKQPFSGTALNQQALQTLQIPSAQAHIQQQRQTPARRQRRANSSKSTPVMGPMRSKQTSVSSVSSMASISSRVTKPSPLIRPSRRSSSNLPSLASSANTSPMIQPISSATTVTNLNTGNQSSNITNNTNNISTSSSSDQHAGGWSSDSVSPEGINDMAMPPPQKRTTRRQSVTSLARSGISFSNSNQATSVVPDQQQALFLMPSSQTKRSTTRNNSQTSQTSQPSSTKPVAATPASLMNLPDQNDVEMADLEITEQQLNNAVNTNQNIESQENNGKRGSITQASKPVTRKKSVSMSPFTCVPANTTSASPSLSASNTPILRSAVSKRTTSARKSSVPKNMLPSPSLNPIKPKISIQPNAQSVWKSRHGSSSSPVLHPKISPHISPRKATINGETSSSAKPTSGSPILNADISLVLASRSNYQNIVDGTHSQLGLSYPDSLSVDLTSKRTSHKLAEQGRRNRINSALTDLAKLLAPTHQASSKALTVEMAIDYIKSLQLEITETKNKLAKYESVDMSLTSVSDALKAVDAKGKELKNKDVKSKGDKASKASERVDTKGPKKSAKPVESDELESE